jgi:hypothetical protein
MLKRWVWWLGEEIGYRGHILKFGQFLGVMKGVSFSLSPQPFIWLTIIDLCWPGAYRFADGFLTRKLAWRGEQFDRPPAIDN